MDEKTETITASDDLNGFDPFIKIMNPGAVPHLANAGQEKSVVIPAKAGVQFSFFDADKEPDPRFRCDDEQRSRRAMNSGSR